MILINIKEDYVGLLFGSDSVTLKTKTHKLY